MCTIHLGIHLKANKNHMHESLDIELETYRLSQFRSKLLERILKIKVARNKIKSDARLLIIQIETTSEQTAGQLDRMINSYIELHRRNKFCTSELQTIENIELFDIDIKINGIDKIISEVQKAYSQEIVAYEKNVQNMENQFLSQHNGGFWCGVITNDYKAIITGGCDSTIRVWDFDQKIQKFVLFGHSSFIKCIGLTRDNEYIISGSLDASVRIWNFKQRSQVAVLRGHKGGVFGVSYIENASLIVSADREGVVIVWNFNDYSIKNQKKFPTAIWSMELMRNQTNLLLGVGRKILLIELDKLVTLKSMEAHSNSVLSFALASDERKLFSGSSDNLIYIWDLIADKKTGQLVGHNGSVRSLALTLDDQYLVSGSDDKSVRVWDLIEITQVYLIKNQTSSICTILRADQYFILISEDSSIGELNIARGESKINQILEPFEFYFVDFTADSKLVGYGSQNKGVIWDLQREVVINHLQGHQLKVQSVVISSNCRYAITCSLGKENNLFYWDLHSNQILFELRGHTNSVFCASFSKDSFMAASGSGDKTVRTWNLREGRQDFEFREHTDKVYSVKFICNKNLLVSAGGDKKIIVWNLTDKSQYAIFMGHNNKIWSLILTDDEKFIISGDFYDGIRVWNVENKCPESGFGFRDDALIWLKQNGIKLDSVRRFLKV